MLCGCRPIVAIRNRKDGQVIGALYAFLVWRVVCNNNILHMMHVRQHGDNLNQRSG